MKHTAKRLANLSTRGVVFLQDIKPVNYPLYRFVEKNKELVRKGLKNYSILLIDDEVEIDDDYVKAYIQYHYKGVVSIPELKKNKKLYSAITKLRGRRTVGDYLKSLGIDSTNHGKNPFTEWDIKQVLKKKVNKYGVVTLTTKDSSFRQVLYRNARKNGMTTKEYIKYLGFKPDYDEDIKKLRQQGYGYRATAKKLGLSYMTIYHKVKKWKEQERS